MKNCPRCSGELTPEQWATGECPHCKVALGEAVDQGFLAASLEFDPRMMEQMNLWKESGAEFTPPDERIGNTDATILSGSGDFGEEALKSASWKADFTPPNSDELRSLAP